MSTAVEEINNTTYYNLYPIEAIDMMIAIFGKEKVISFCLINAFKYRMRLGYKDKIEKDLEKEKWYLNKAKEIESLK